MWMAQSRHSRGSRSASGDVSDEKRLSAGERGVHVPRSDATCSASSQVKNPRGETLASITFWQPTPLASSLGQQVMSDASSCLDPAVPQHTERNRQISTIICLSGILSIPLTTSHIHWCVSPQFLPGSSSSLARNSFPVHVKPAAGQRSLHRLQASVQYES
ncbi:hypothetical protein CALVIDRAFT_370194 [Calocera viscosa TUFC12733]|uniref:Uncharacterized protein n=1 Tax=Calocera viscosa (strain TUFC12733) TaxID=1330018 RepID=A0A167GXX5_CALVF|nr:hypothetical protein CALVIDRAFT_370194 [Calocera viscosa TUFC12733]